MKEDVLPGFILGKDKTAAVILGDFEVYYAPDGVAVLGRHTNRGTGFNLPVDCVNTVFIFSGVQ